VSWQQTLFGAVLVAALLFLSIFYTWRQVLALRRLRLTPDLPADEMSYQRRQAWRRLVTCALMFVLAVLLTGALVYLEEPAQRLADARDAAQKAGEPDELSPEDRGFARFYGAFWMIFLLVLMVVVLLAALDLWSTRRYGLREHRKLLADRRAMLERQVAQLRQERNGNN
jgi:cytochrome c-type biogenesis protein CcmH/NrfG